MHHIKEGPRELSIEKAHRKRRKDQSQSRVCMDFIFYQTYCVCLTVETRKVEVYNNIKK